MNKTKIPTLIITREGLLGLGNITGVSKDAFDKWLVCDIKTLLPSKAE